MTTIEQLLEENEELSIDLEEAKKTIDELLTALESVNKLSMALANQYMMALVIINAKRGENQWKPS